jgi:hypothetical protein
VSSSNHKGLSAPRWAVLAAGAACWAGAVASVAATPSGPSLCGAGEAAVFSCPVGQGKFASLCASTDLGEHSGTLVYRFGRPGALELVFPETPAHPRALFRRGSMGSAGGGGDFVRFSRGPYTYTLYADVGPAGESAGVAVSQDGQAAAHLPCRGPALDPDQNWARVYKARLPRDDTPFTPPGR